MLKEMWKDSGENAYYSRMAGSDPQYDENFDFVGVHKYNRFEKSRLFNFVSLAARATVCFLIGHNIQVEEGGNAESGPSVSWGCSTCYGAGGYSSM